MYTHTHPFNGLLSGTTRVSGYPKGKTNLDFTKARDSEWQWHQLGHMQVCTSLQTDNYASTPPLSFFTGQVPFLSPNCPLSFWLNLPWRVLSISWCCPHRPCMVLLTYVYLALFLAPWQCLTVPSLLQLCQKPTRLFSLLSMKSAESFSVLPSQRHQGVFLHFFWVSSFHSRTSHTSAIIIVYYAIRQHTEIPEIIQ